MHGGDVWQVAEDWQLKESDLIDFSANINPRGLPLRARRRLLADAHDFRLLTRYPDPDARELRRALAAVNGVPLESIVIGEGATALLAAAARALCPRNILIASPAFSEYGRSGNLRTFLLAENDAFRLPVEQFCQRIAADQCDAQCDAVIINNPHNPSGSLLTRDEVLSIHKATRVAGRVLIVDEAFIDYTPEETITPLAAAEDGLIAIRSLTKFYGCPSLRVGYAVAQPEMAARITSQLPSWPVSLLALNALTEAVQDDEFAETTCTSNRIERERLTVGLASLGLQVYPGAANYLLVRLPEPYAAELRRRLAVEHSILIRDCSSFDGLERGRYIRVAVRSAADNNLLLAALRQTHRAPSPR